MARPPRPPASHREPAPREHDPDELAAWTFRPIGVVRSPWRYVHDAPRQGGAGGDAEAVVVLRRGMQNCLKDLAGFERVWVVFVFSYARGWRQQVVPPRDTVKRGVLATRSPHRPNPIGITAARLVGIRGTRITIAGHDLLDGTPVLDVKPYLPYCDAHPQARTGWAAALAAGAPDHRWA
jgi:tRNA-Thr(GGU) m(6)t(6)A37 methyltransferase TsaA